MLEQHFGSSDPEVSHAMYYDDTVLEFSQSGERFVRVEDLREWRSGYPTSTTVELREIRVGKTCGWRGRTWDRTRDVAR
jgi:hypothetical protein